MSANNRRCSVCRNVGHNRTHCEDPTVIQEFEMDKVIFNRLMLQKIQRNGVCFEFSHFISEIIDETNLNKLKYFVNRYGSISNVRKPLLVATYIYHLCDQFIQSYQRMTPEIFFIADRERTYWYAKRMGIHAINNTNHIIMRHVNLPGTVPAAAVPTVADIPTPRWRAIPYSIFEWEDNDYVEKPRFNIQIIDQNIDIVKSESETTLECGICYDMIPKKKIVGLGCKHEFCDGCIEKTMTISQNTSTHPACAFCRAKYQSLCIQTNEFKEKMKSYCV
jgi:hypothetical protein